jgi:hypothetical protein
MEVILLAKTQAQIAYDDEDDRLTDEEAEEIRICLEEYKRNPTSPDFIPLDDIIAEYRQQGITID